MPAKKRKDTVHRTSARHPNICCRYSTLQKAWLWGYRIEITVGGKTTKYHVHDFPDSEAAEVALNTLKEKARERKHGILPISRPPLSDLITLQLRALRGGSEYVRASRVLKLWLSLVPEDIKVDEVYTDQIQTYIDKRLDDGIAPSSIDRELNIIVACLNAAKIHYKEMRQWDPPPCPRLKFSQATTRKIIPAQHYARLIEWLMAPRKEGEQFQTFEARHRTGRVFRFMMLTGCRTGEAFGLKEQDIEWEFDRVKIVGTKTANRRADTVRYVPLAPETRQVLREQIEDNQRVRTGLKEVSSPYIFALGPTCPPKVYNMMRTACAAVRIENVTPYVARHTFITATLMAGVDLKTVGTITGQSDRTMTMHYAHFTPESAAAAAIKISEIERARLGKE